MQLVLPLLVSSCLLFVTNVAARPSGDALMQVLTPVHKGTAPAHPHVNVVVLFGTTPEGAVADPTTFRARLGGTDVTGRFVPLAAEEFGGAAGLRATLDATDVRVGASNRLRLRVRSLPVTIGARTRKVKDRERVRFTAVDRPNEPPTARAIADSDLVFPGLPIRFDARTSSDAELDALTHSWDFGDGTTARGPTAEHAFAAGASNVVVTVAVGDGTSTSMATLTLPREPDVDPDRTEGLLRVEADDAPEFGAVAVGGQATRTFTVVNMDATATSQLLVRVSTSAAAFTVEPNTLDLGPSAQGTLTLRFAPSAPGHADTNVSLVASATNRAAVSFLAHGFGGTAPGSGPTLAARSVYHRALHPSLPGSAVHVIRPDGTRLLADNTVHPCVVPGGGVGTNDACLVDADCGVFGGTCDESRTVLLDPEDLCADSEGTLVVLSFDGAVTDPNPNAETPKSAVLLRVSLDDGGTATTKDLLARVTGDTTNLTCDDVALAARGRVYVAEYFDVDDDACDRTEREALVAIRKDGEGTNVLENRLDSIAGVDGCTDEDSSAALASAGTGNPFFVSFDLSGIWRYDPPRHFLSGITNPEPLDVHPDGAVMYATATTSGTRTAVNLYKVSAERVQSGPVSVAAASPCATYTLPTNDGRAFVTALAVDPSAADASTAIALVSVLASDDALAGVLAPALAPHGTVAFTVPSGSADTCAAVGLVALEPLDLLSF